MKKKRAIKAIGTRVVEEQNMPQALNSAKAKPISNAVKNKIRSRARKGFGISGKITPRTVLSRIYQAY